MVNLEKFNTVNILFPTDFSEASAKSFGAAVTLAEKLTLPIMILHVYRPPVVTTGYDDTGLEVVTEQLISGMEDVIRAQMADFIKDISETHQLNKRGIAVEYSIRMGFVADEIARMADETHSAYITVTVRHSHTGERILLGSAVNGLLRKSHQPLFAFPEDWPLRNFRRIAYATDLSFSDGPVIARLLEFARLFDATVLCFHVHDSNLDTENAIIQEFNDTYRSEIEQGLISFQLSENLRVMDGIDYFVQENAIDLLVMLKQRRYWLDFLEGSYTRKMAFHAGIPLLVYHE